MRAGLGRLQPRLPLPLHFQMAKKERQVSNVRTLVGVELVRQQKILSIFISLTYAS